MRTNLGVFVCCLATLCSLQSAWAQSETNVRAIVIIVADDLSLRPVPKAPFVVRDTRTGLEVASVSTSFTGEIELFLVNGEYVIETVAPVSFEGSQFSWAHQFSVEGDQMLSLELSNDNARRIAAAVVSQSGMTEGEIFRQFGNSVFKVISAGGHGSGFLVDPSGLILTNHHVVEGSEYFAVEASEGEKFPAELLVSDPLNDMAIIQVHREVVVDRSPLNLADAAYIEAAEIGDRVVAIGSPLATENILTAGLISKVEEGAIYSDVNINPGNSGGPLFDMNGTVLGINTFGVPTSRGPGVSGIVRIDLSEPLMREARTIIATVGNFSEYRLLPEPSSFTYPADLLRELALETKVRPQDYHLEAKSFDVTFLDPVVIASLQIDAEREAAGTQRRRNRGTEESVATDFYEWRRYVGDYRPVVTIQATPELGMPPGSWAAAVLGGMSGTPATGLTYWFKSDFDRMELYRNGELVEPYHPGRSRQVVDESSLNGDQLTDLMYFGKYEYPPEVFMPGNELEIRIWEKGKDDPIVDEVKDKQIELIWSHFQPYFEAREQAPFVRDQQ